MPNEFAVVYKDDNGKSHAQLVPSLEFATGYMKTVDPSREPRIFQVYNSLDHHIRIPEDIESGNLYDLTRGIKELYHAFLCAYDEETGVSPWANQHILLALQNLASARCHCELAELEQAKALGGRK